MMFLVTIRSLSKAGEKGGSTGERILCIGLRSLNSILGDASYHGGFASQTHVAWFYNYCVPKGRSTNTFSLFTHSLNFHSSISVWNKVVSSFSSLQFLQMFKEFNLKLPNLREFELFLDFLELSLMNVSSACQWGIAKVVSPCPGTPASQGAGLWELRKDCLCKFFGCMWEEREETGNIPVLISNPPFLENPPGI